MKTALFGKHIEPACQYCENGKLTKDNQMVLCMKHGAKQPYSNCRSFIYAPLKRIPKKSAPLPKYNKKDFEL
ncbi:hypothetical protein RBG61_02295 [Paludicola sp. MB14-C6]|uniref:hypothetical protein n=1 Tax=Paludihabitans sp. MB14-C6 TaxID=3070656 RepID=UPI0027DC1E33|nr:hypothetical protein [Paludicola sp. MB14-C6]WMJ23523.1 hypothetical protein RBG61_02295 [Paludicola sp. MB14-C6]